MKRFKKRKKLFPDNWFIPVHPCYPNTKKIKWRTIARSADASPFFIRIYANVWRDEIKWIEKERRNPKDICECRCTECVGILAPHEPHH